MKFQINHCKPQATKPPKSPLNVLLAIVFWLVVWQLFSMYVGQELLVPAPFAVFSELISLSATVAFWRSAFYSLVRIFSGAFLGLIAGCLLAVLSSFSWTADTILSPAVRIVRAVPVASFIILLLLWVRRDFVPVIIAAIVVCPIIWSDVSMGIANLPGEFLEFGKAYRLSNSRMWRYVRFPWILPHLVSGIYTSLGMAWKSGVAAEVLSLPHSGIGTEIYNSRLYLETAGLFAWTIVVIVLSALLEALIRAAMHRLRTKYRELP